MENKLPVIQRSALLSRYRKLIRYARENGSEKDVSDLRMALKWLEDSHLENPLQQWSSPVIHNALDIALIVSLEMGLGTLSVIASLLYQDVQGNRISLKRIELEYGEKIAEITGGLARITEIKSDKVPNQAENVRNLILTMARDVRVILIKIAERLFAMRRLDNLPEEQKIVVVSDSKYIYSPIAHRLGLYNIMLEFEDIALRFLDPASYLHIEKKLKATRTKRNRFIQEFITPVEEILRKNRIAAEIKGRPKAISSIWRKMKSQNVEFDEVYDIFAIRIIIETKPAKEKADCWRVYSLITDLYKPNPERLRDWISVPKSTGYESLHTTVVVPGGTWVEVQIRSRRMDDIAERGFAAHWKYKGIKDEAGIDSWLSRVRDLLDNPEGEGHNVLDDLRLSLENKEIFVFTPQGDLKKFPNGATVLDFAFDIHSAIGSSCVGARINGKNRPIRYALKNGDKVEIIRSKHKKANEDWLNYVVTSKAKSKIRQALKEARLKEAENGKEMLKRRFKNWKIDYTDPNIRKLLAHYKYNDALDLYFDIATEKLDLLEIKEVILAQENRPVAGSTVENPSAETEKTLETALGQSEDYLVIDEKLSGLDYRLANCCNPIFGDRIFGFVTVTSGISIHRMNCPNAQELLSRYGYRVVNAKWTKSEKDHHFLATLRITGIDDIGIVNTISEVVSRDLKVNMRSFQMETSEGLFEGIIKVFVRDTDHLEMLKRRLHKLRGVNSVRRID